MLATVTPLASIFGSGFLIIVPILERELELGDVDAAGGRVSGLDGPRVALYDCGDPSLSQA